MQQVAGRTRKGRGGGSRVESGESSQGLLPPEVWRPAYWATYPMDFGDNTVPSLNPGKYRVVWSDAVKDLVKTKFKVGQDRQLVRGWRVRYSQWNVKVLDEVDKRDQQRAEYEASRQRFV